MNAFITSSEFDIDDGHNFSFIRRVLPDLTFRGSSGTSPSVQLSLFPLMNSGSGYNNPLSNGGSDAAAVTQLVSSDNTYTVEQFTGQVFVRVRGRQMAFKIATTQDQTGVSWQMGAMRLDVQPDGRRG